MSVRMLSPPPTHSPSVRKRRALSVYRAAPPVHCACTPTTMSACILGTVHYPSRFFLSLALSHSSVRSTLLSPASSSLFCFPPFLPQHSLRRQQECVLLARIEHANSPGSRLNQQQHHGKQ